MSDLNNFPRQACRCGYVFGTYDAFKAHANPGSPVENHLPPADVGLVEIDGEWIFLVEASLPDSTARRAPRGQGVKYVPAAERPADEYSRECVSCGTIFERPRKRGRPPTKCPPCRGV